MTASSVRTEFTPACCHPPIRALYVAYAPGGLIGNARYDTAEARWAHRAEVDALVEAWTAQRTKHEVIKILGEVEAMELPVSDHPDTFARACDLSIRLRARVTRELFFTRSGKARRSIA